jgi:galactose-1-phosphate uridylyltransferase
MFHTRKSHKKYLSFPKHTSCPFCESNSKKESIAETTYTQIVSNRVHYDVWELRTVVDHLLILPKRHVLSLHDLTNAEKVDIMNVIADYESQGYNVYARAASNAQRSVPHQHTHLIKTAGKPGSFMLFIRRPYLLIKR